ncbi:MAG TPA: Crp/Fnr family transcriptional regulator [Myxococcaceae bacterium]|nr:Crp/Fnr family transcriptional regulator [Myxococcaceae bacterium]
MSYAVLLSKVPLFAALSPEKLEGLAALLIPRQYADQEIIFHAGDVGNGLYVVRKGGVTIRLSSPGGKEVILSLLSRGDVFGELALIDGEPRSADALARDETQLLMLPRDAFLRHIHEQHEVMMQLLVSLSRQVRRITGLVHDAAFLDVRGRLAQTLLELARTLGQPGPDGVVHVPRPTQRDLANMIGGVSRESINKVLRTYEQQGLLRQERGQIVLLDLDRLRQEIDEG